MSAPRSAPRNHQMSRFVQRALQSRRIQLIGLGVIALLLATTALARATTIPPPAPVTLTPPNGSTTNNNLPTVSGTATASVTITVFIDGTANCTTTADASGNWSCTILSVLPDGTHAVKARATDSGGEQSVDSNTNTFIVDTTPPPAPVTLTPANGAITSDSTPTVSGTAEASSTVTVLIDGSVSGTVTANAAGTWSFTIPTALTDGSHTARANATDGAGNSSTASNTNIFTVDTTPPETTIYIPRITRGGN